MNERLSNSEIRNLRFRFKEIDKKDAEKRKQKNLLQAKRREEEITAIREKRQKEYEDLPWWSKLLGCWIYMCCTIRHPIEGPEVVGMFIANIMLLAVISSIFFSIYDAVGYFFCL